VPEVDVAGGRVVVADRPGLVTPFPDDDTTDGTADDNTDDNTDDTTDDSPEGGGDA
jgi:hypothetical protein